MSALIETFTFRLVAGAEESDFLEADRRAQWEMSAGSPGLLRRTTARGADGDWIVITLWRSVADADDAARAGAEGAATTALAAFVEPSTARVARFEALD